MAEIALLATCLGSGAWIASRIGLSGRDLSLAITLCLGFTAFAVCGLVVILLGGWLIPRRVPAALVVLTIAATIAAIVHRRHLLAQPRLLVALIAVLALFTLRNWTYLTNDSFFLHYIVDLAIDRGRLAMDDYGWHFLGHPIWLHVAQIWANALGEPFIRWVFPVAYLLAAWVAIRAATASTGKAEMLLAVGPVVLLFGSYQMVIQAQMANHHMMVALILLVAGVLLVRDNSRQAAIAAGVMLASVPLMRMEGAMLVGLFALGLAPVLATPARAALVTGIPLVVAFPWFAFIAAHRSDGMLSLSQLLLNYAALALVCGGVSAILFLARWPSGARVLASWQWLCAVGGLLLIVGGAVVSPATTLSNISIVPQNMLVFARWGVFWDVALLVTLGLAGARLCRVQLPPSPYASFAAVTFLVVGLLFFVGAMRGPYRYNWSDSATRMLVHVAPLAAVWLGERLAILQQAIAAKNGRQKDLL